MSPMLPVSNDTEYTCWAAEGHSLRIAYDPAVVDQIYAAAVEGLSTLRRGGIEIGGVLLGSRKQDLVSIRAFRPIACSHASGPSFVLSEADQAGLVSLLEQIKAEAAGSGLEAVGWYHSHTRSEVCLSPEDLEIYNRYFPEPWQVALVVQPAQFGPGRAGFFFRERDNAIRTESSHCEFPVKLSRRAAARVAPPPREKSVRPPVPRFEMPAPVEEADSPLTPPAFTQIQPERSRKWMWGAIAVVVVIAGFLLGFRTYSTILPDQQLGLRVTEIDGQLLIEWDRSSRSIRDAASAMVYILDGTERVDVPMDGERLREGSVTYARRQDRVDVFLRVERAGGRRSGEFIRFIGQPVRARPSQQEREILRERDELQHRVLVLQAELNRRIAQVRELQQGGAGRSNAGQH